MLEQIEMWTGKKEKQNKQKTTKVKELKKQKKNKKNVVRENCLYSSHVTNECLFINRVTVRFCLTVRSCFCFGIVASFFDDIFVRVWKHLWTLNSNFYFFTIFSNLKFHSSLFLFTETFNLFSGQPYQRIWRELGRRKIDEKKKRVLLLCFSINKR